MHWLNEPTHWQAREDELLVTADPCTDFWRATRNEFVRLTAATPEGAVFQARFTGWRPGARTIRTLRRGGFRPFSDWKGRKYRVAPFHRQTGSFHGVSS
jgi:regulation of enolase protein 1 (concanavalin A-like superfamily)